MTNSIIFCKRLSGSIKSWEHTPATSITSETETNEKQSNKMPDQPFDIKTATALVQPYDGSAEGLDAFLDATSLLAEITPATQVATMLKFLKTRLTGKARLGLPENINTIAELEQNIRQRCASKITPDNIIAKMKAIKQRGSVEDFCEEVDSLTAKLKAVYLEKKMPNELANSMATKKGVETLINGTNSQDNKLILKAGTFSDIKDAIQKLLENSNNNTNNSQILNFNTNRQFNRNPIGFNRGRGNYNYNYNNSYNSERRDYRNNNFRYQQLQERNNFVRNYHRGHAPSHYNTQSNNQFRQANRGRGPQNNPRRIYTTSAEEMNQRDTPTQMQQPQQIANGNTFLGTMAPRANQGQYMQ